MQADLNPFVPGAGAPAPKLAGRDDIVSDVAASCKSALNGIAPRFFMFTGLRGVGKTALLTTIARQAEENAHCVVSMREAREGEPLARQLFFLMKATLLKLSTSEDAQDIIGGVFRALRNFARTYKLSFANVAIGIDLDAAPGVAESGDLACDLSDVFTLIGTAARRSGKAWVLLIDEVQTLSRKDLGALIAAMKKVSGRGLPVVLIAAGLPQAARLAAETESCAEQLFDWRRIGSLGADAIEAAVCIPLEQKGIAIEKAAVEKIAQITQGHPFFIQALGFYIWLQGQKPTVTLEGMSARRTGRLLNP